MDFGPGCTKGLSAAAVFICTVNKAEEKFVETNMTFYLTVRDYKPYSESLSTVQWDFTYSTVQV